MKNGLLMFIGRRTGKMGRLFSLQNTKGFKPMLSISKMLCNVKHTFLTFTDQVCTLISPYLNTQFRFLRITKRFANLRNPVTFSEKLSWLKLYRYGDDPLVRQCADKLRVRDYVAGCGLEHLLIPLIGVYENTDQIPWEKLPDKFVLKWNFGCGFNLLCPDKGRLDIPSATRRLKKWGRTPYWLVFAERQYRIKDRRMLCETFLETPDGQDLVDFKFYCFHGKALAILVIARPIGGEPSAVFMSPEWEYLSDIPSRYNQSFMPEKPTALLEMLAAAEVLSAPFPFVRVDFYEQRGRPFFGELTFTPASGICPSETTLHGKSMGAYIDLGDMQK